MSCSSASATGRPGTPGAAGQALVQANPTETRGEAAEMHIQLGSEMAWSVFVLPSHQRGPCLNSSPFSLEEKKGERLVPINSFTSHKIPALQEAMKDCGI